MKIVSIGHPGQRTKRCVISLGVGKRTFSDCLLRLEESLRRVGFQGDYLSWSDNLPGGCPEHFDVPFGFKSYCFLAAKKLGYEQILWIDSACVAIRSLDGIFKQIQDHGYILFNNNYGQTMGQWSSDEALAHNGIGREEALNIPEIPCSTLGLSMQSEQGLQFLAGWHQILSDGVTARGTSKKIETWDDYASIAWNRNSFISADPRVLGHRHDQTAAGIVAHRLGMKPYADELRDIHFKEKPIKANTAILHHREFGTSITPLDQIYHNVFFRIPFIETPMRKLRSLKSRALGLAGNHSE